MTTVSDQKLNSDNRFKLANRIIILGMMLNVTLMIGKLTIAHYSKSAALRADGIESACDLMVSLAMLWAIRVSHKPFDRCHPYGHGKVESLAALLVGLVIMSTGLWVLSEAGQTIFRDTVGPVHWLAAVMGGITVAVKLWAARFTRKQARTLGSPMLAALAQDHRTDVMTSVATILGAGGAAIGYLYFDPTIAAITSLLILRAGADTCRQAFNDLMDTALPKDEIEAISRDICAIDGVESIDGIRGRRSGQTIILDLKLAMNPQMTVQRSHDITAQVKQHIFTRHPSVGDVMIHVNPHQPYAADED